MLGLTKRVEPTNRDLLVVLSSDGLADIAEVVEINEERILAVGENEYSVPIGDTRPYISRRGRVFAYPATYENVADVKRIAALEISTTLKHLTHFEKERAEPAGKMPIGKLVFVGIAVFILILFMVMK